MTHKYTRGWAARARRGRGAAEMGNAGTVQCTTPPRFQKKFTVGGAGMAKKTARRKARKPVLRLGGGVMRVVLGPGLGDPTVWTGHLDAQGALIRRAADVDLERMWERSDG